MGIKRVDRCASGITISSERRVILVMPGTLFFATVWGAVAASCEYEEVICEVMADHIKISFPQQVHPRVRHSEQGGVQFAEVDSQICGSDDLLEDFSCGSYPRRADPLRKIRIGRCVGK